MLLTDLFQLLMDAQATGQGCGTDQICSGSAFSSIVAAFATEGYWMQADLISHLLWTDLGVWAPILYAVSALMGMFGVAMGMPPKTYIWFFIGPGLYHWLLSSTVPVHGVEWRVAGVPQDQREVWRMAEVGLLNSWLYRRISIGFSFSFTDGITADIEVSNVDGPSEPVYVAWFFAWYDELISETVQRMIDWTGVSSAIDNDVGSGATSVPIFTMFDIARGGDIYTYRNNSGAPEGVRWYLLSDLKWGMLEDITGARMHNADLRDAFITFMSSECGEILADYINPESYVASRNASAQNLPQSIFYTGSTDGSAFTKVNYHPLSAALRAQEVPIMPSVMNLFKGYGPARGVDDSSFRRFFNNSLGDTLAEVVSSGSYFNCEDFFTIVVNGFRWEAGHIYHQLAYKHQPTVGPEEVIYSLFYGWDIRCPAGVNCAGGFRPSTIELRSYLQDLVLVYLIRNEMKLAPKVLYNPRYSAGQNIERFADTHQATIGSKNKYGELYTWATLLPYVQGVLIYFLCIAYPVACVLIVVPGWHKMLFTWMSFWAWAKMWDLGFAIVKTLERTVWALVGNNSKGRGLSGLVMEMQAMGKIDVMCDFGDFRTDGIGCSVPRVCDGACGGGAVTGLKDLWQIFDRAILLSGVQDLDLANAYYIYIMAALYMSVPVVTGQMVLGAKAGSAGLVNNMIGGVSGEAGRAATAGFQNELTQQAKSAGAAVQQTGYLQGMRGSALTSQALAAGNIATVEDAKGFVGAATREAYDQMIGARHATAESQNAALSMSDKAMGQIIGRLPGANEGPPAGGPGSGGKPTHKGMAAGAEKAWDMASAAMSYDAAQAKNADLVNMQTLRADVSLGTAAGQIMGKGYGLAQSRWTAGAHLAGENSAWAKKNDYANAVSGELGAMGVSAGVLDPGPKPVHFEGTAAQGWLGRENKSLMNFASGHGSPYFQMAQGMISTMNSTVGPDAIKQMAQIWTPNNMMPFSQDGREYMGRAMANTATDFVRGGYSGGEHFNATMGGLTPSRGWGDSNYRNNFTGSDRQRPIFDRSSNPARGPDGNAVGPFTGVAQQVQPILQQQMKHIPNGQ